MGYMKENWDYHEFSLFKISMEKISNEKDSTEKLDIYYK